MRRARARQESIVAPIPAQRHPCPSPPADQESWPQVWAALERARAHYDPQVLDAAEKAALEVCRSTARTFGRNAASAYGLHQQQAAALAELALIKAIRQCRAGPGTSVGSSCMYRPPWNPSCVTQNPSCASYRRGLPATGNPCALDWAVRRATFGSLASLPIPRHNPCHAANILRRRELLDNPGAVSAAEVAVGRGIAATLPVREVRKHSR